MYQCYLPLQNSFFPTYATLFRSKKMPTLSIRQAEIYLSILLINICKHYATAICFIKQSDMTSGENKILKLKQNTIVWAVDFVSCCSPAQLLIWSMFQKIQYIFTKFHTQPIITEYDSCIQLIGFLIKINRQNPLEGFLALFYFVLIPQMLVEKIKNVSNDNK